MSDNNKPLVSSEELDQAFAKPLVNEAKQVAREVGQVLETGGSTQDPSGPQAQQQKQQKEFEEKQKTAKAKKFWQDYLAKFSSDRQRFEQKKQLNNQIQAEEARENEKKVEIKQFEKKKKDESFESQHIKGLQAKTEMKKGVGG